MKLKGIVVPVGTPVDRNERTDEPGLRRFTRHLLDNGVHGILANGTMGGFAHLEDREQVRAVEIVLDEVSGKVPVIANVGKNGTRRALRRARELELLNPDYLAVLPPFYFLMTQKDLSNFYWEMVNEVRTPVFLYNNPVTTKVDLEFETIVALSEHPNVIGIKESKQDFDKWMRMVRHFQGSDFSILIGTDLLVSAALTMGCDGVVAGLSNLCPQTALQLYAAVCAGDKAEAEALQERMINLFSIFDVDDAWGSFEVALQHLGICEKVTVSPFRSITDPAARKRIEEMVDTNLRLPYASLKREGEAQ